jgi:hypothetical protein
MLPTGTSLRQLNIRMSDIPAGDNGVLKRLDVRC